MIDIGVLYIFVNRVIEIKIVSRWNNEKGFFSGVKIGREYLFVFIS